MGIFKIDQVQKFTKYTERLIVGFKEVEQVDKVYGDQTQMVPDYNPQIQRKTNNAKVERIADFLITDPTAMFPTNIVIAIRPNATRPPSFFPYFEVNLNV